ncbi:unnamed protein product [Scytosiphon promiscuus]
MGEVQQRETAVRGMLHRDPSGALRKCLEDPPILCRDEAVKNKSLECVLLVLMGVREDQIEKCLADLSLDEIDILVKYVYKGLGMPRNNGPLFKWHAKVIEKGGPGCVMRTLVARQTV